MSVRKKKQTPNLRSRHQPKHYVGGSNEFGNSREEVRKKKRPAFTNYFKVAVESVAANWMRPGGGNPGRQLEKTVGVHRCHVVMSRHRQGGREGADVHRRTADRRRQTEEKSPFTVRLFFYYYLGGCLHAQSVSLSGNLFSV